ncbi:MAG: pyridoxamine 5'-phosphate oxidase [Myxococcales bacterium]
MSPSSSPESLGPDPLTIFDAWFAEARALDPKFADAMTLATSSVDGRPSARTVLYKGLVDGAVCFVTNYESTKGRELIANPQAALVFFWASLNRQVRFEGRAEPASAAWSDGYFASRARSSQIGAWASAQSQVIASRDVLEARIAEAEARFAGVPVTRPPFWGGFRLVPDRVEFWLGQDARLHDRFSYFREPGGWRVSRLSP